MSDGGGRMLDKCRTTSCFSNAKINNRKSMTEKTTRQLFMTKTRCSAALLLLLGTHCSVIFLVYRNTTTSNDDPLCVTMTLLWYSILYVRLSFLVSHCCHTELIIS